MPKNSESWTLKKIIRKAADIKLNTAIALSKSIHDEEKAKKKRAKKVKVIPYNLMKDPKEVKEILDIRLSNVILQASNFNLKNVDVSKKRIWNKTSLDFDLKPGDLSFDNINLSELMEYYVPALVPPLSPSKIRMGDKIMSMSLIEGREKSYILTKRRDPPTIEEASTLSHENLVTEFVNNDSFKNVNKEQSVNVCPDPVALEMTNQSLSLCIESKTENDREMHRFMTMFNNCKHSDLFVLLKSGDILFLHKFVLTSWLCDEELLRESQQCILDIDDDVVTKFFKHLYSDGKFNINDIIEGDDCAKLCKMFGLDQPTLVKHEKKSEAIDSNYLSSRQDPVSSNLSCFSSPKNHIFTTPQNVSNTPPQSASFWNNYLLTEENNCHENFSFDKPDSWKPLPSPLNPSEFQTVSSNLIQSTPRILHPPVFHEESTNINQAPILDCSDRSNQDLFETFTETSFSQNVDSDGNIDRSKISLLKSPELDKTQMKSPSKDFRIYNELCVFSNDIYNDPVPDKSIMNSGNLNGNNEIDDSVIIIEDNPNSIEQKEEAVIAKIEKDSSSKTFVGNSEILEEKQEFQSPNSSTETKILSDSSSLSKRSSLVDNYEFPADNNEYEKKFTVGNLMEFQEDLSLIDNSDLQFDACQSPTISRQNNSSLKIYMENSPLPLFQRLGLKTGLQNRIAPIINDSKEKEIIKPTMSSEMETKTADELKDVIPKVKEVKRKVVSAKDKMKKSEEVVVEDMNSQRITKQKKERVSKKRKSNEKVLKTNSKTNSNEFETPEKRGKIEDPFTPLPDFRAMPTPLMAKRLQAYGIKQKLSKKLSVKVLEDIHFHTHQIDNDSEPHSSSTLESSSASLQESDEDQSPHTSEVNLNDDPDLFIYMKSTYFREILMHEPIDIKQVLLNLKANGSNISLKTLNDYFDSQCILVASEEKTGNNKKYNRPIKASKLVL